MNRCRILLALAAASFVATARAQTWETVDENPPTYFSWTRDLACAPDGNLYQLTSVTDGIDSRFVRRSTDQGATWTTVSGPFDVVQKLAVDGQNNVYLTGARPSDGYWTVLKSSDAGLNWTPIFAGTSPSFSGLYGVRGMAVDAAGVVYVAGDYKVYVTKAREWLARWVVRKGVPGTAGSYVWSEVDTFTPDIKTGAWAHSIAIRPATTPGASEEIYVGGEAGGRWTIRRSVNGGGTWTTIDSLAGKCWTLAVAPDGGIFAAGEFAQAGTRGNPGANYTIVRKGTVSPGGVTWTEQARIAWASDWSSYFAANDMTVDGFGRVFVAGSGAGPSGLPHGWRVWASQDGNAPYFFTDLPTDGANAWSVVHDASGHVFVGGSYVDPVTGQKASRVRRLLANP